MYSSNYDEVLQEYNQVHGEIKQNKRKETSSDKPSNYEI